MYENFLLSLWIIITKNIAKPTTRLWLNLRYPHGIAVSYGMDIANAVSVQLGLLDDETRLRVNKTLRKVRRQTQFPVIDIDVFLNYLKKDKKNLSTGIRLILSKGFGDMFLTTVDADDSFRSVVEECFMNFQQENV